LLRAREKRNGAAATGGLRLPAPGAPVTPGEASAAGPRQGWLAHTFESLSNRNFRMLWLGMVTSMAGAQMQFFVRGILRMT
jgi:hypothetical protein